MVDRQKYIFIRNDGNFAVFRKGVDGMVILKLNQGTEEKDKITNFILLCSFFLISAYIISIGLNQKPEIIIAATNKIGEYLKSCGY